MKATSNVINFPKGRTGCSRFVPVLQQNQLAHDLLAIANYFEICAHGSPCPKWMKAMAKEARTMAKDVQN